MASPAERRPLVLCIGNETLRGTVGGTTLECRVRLGAGLRARLTPAAYRFSPPTKHPAAGTVAYATLSSAGLSGGRGGSPDSEPTDSSTPPWLGSDKRKLDSAPGEGGTRTVMYNPARVECEKSMDWIKDSKESGRASLKGEVTNLSWTPTRGPGTLVFASRSIGGWNDVIVLNSSDELMRALKAAGGCALIVNP